MNLLHCLDILCETKMLAPVLATVNINIILVISTMIEIMMITSITTKIVLEIETSKKGKKWNQVKELVRLIMV